MEESEISFLPLKKEEIPVFSQTLREAFAVTVREKFGKDEPIPSEKDILANIEEPSAESYHIVYDGKTVGGVVVSINKETHRNSLDLFFIKVTEHTKGLGYKAWKAIERKYPDTKIWETVTPYFEERNIHFYVNKCGFRIVEFFCASHPDNSQEKAEGNEGNRLETFFRFEKIM